MAVDDVPTRAPCRVTADNGPWPLHDAAASRVIEQQALEEVPPGALMARAGFAVARMALALAPHAERVQVWCGPGNNGGDGLVAARHLHAAGRSVQVSLVADAARLPADAARALDQAVAAGVPIRPGAAGAAEAGIVIDALLGLGASRAPEGAVATAISSINRQPAPVLAVDIASGLHADTGALLGMAAVRAHCTLSLLTLKPGCFTCQGRDAAGDIWFDGLRVAPTAAPPTAWLSGPAASRLRPHASHKGSHGDVAVVGGAMGMEGAAWLAAAAALAAGAGRVYCSLLSESATLPSGRPELMVRQGWWRQGAPVLARSTVVCGCGGGEAVRAALPALLSHTARLVLDADALNAIALDTALQSMLRQRQGRGLATLLTPHPLEAARLLGCDAAQVQRDRLAAARGLARQLLATVLLKGSGSVIAAPDGTPWINSSGNGALASPGTGDVLAGWAGGLWAQQPQAAPAEIATAAAWQHGTAADHHATRWPGRPLRAQALVEALIEMG